MRLSGPSRAVMASFLACALRFDAATSVHRRTHPQRFLRSQACYEVRAGRRPVGGQNSIGPARRGCPGFRSWPTGFSGSTGPAARAFCAPRCALQGSVFRVLIAEGALSRSALGNVARRSDLRLPRCGQAPARACFPTFAFTPRGGPNEGWWFVNSRLAPQWTHVPSLVGPPGASILQWCVQSRIRRRPFRRDAIVTPARRK